MKDYTVKKYIEKKLYYGVLEHVEPSNKYNGLTMDAEQMTYKEVKFVMKGLANISTWESIGKIFTICFGEKADLNWFYSGKVTEYYAARNFIIKEFNRLIQREQKLLKSINAVDSVLWKQAGGDRLNRFGGILALNQLGKLYGIYPFELQDRNYMEILLLLTVEKEIPEVQAVYNKLKQDITKK